MKIDWSVSPYSMPQLKGLSKEQKKRVYTNCSATSWRNWKTWVAFLLCFTYSSVIVYLFLNLTKDTESYERFFLLLLGSILGYGVGLYIFKVMHNKIISQFLLEQRRKDGL